MLYTFLEEQPVLVEDDSGRSRSRYLLVVVSGVKAPGRCRRIYTYFLLLFVIGISRIAYNVLLKIEPIVVYLQPPTLPSSHLSFLSVLRYATFRPSLNLLTNSATSLSLAAASLPAPSPSKKLSSRPRHRASCSPTAALKRWYSAGGLKSRSAASCSACLARHCPSNARSESRRDCVL